MVCKKCGTEYKEGDKFCSKCGQLVDQSNDKVNTKLPHKKSGKKTIAVICFWLIFACIALIIGISILSSSDKKSSANNATSNSKATIASATPKPTKPAAPTDLKGFLEYTVKYDIGETTNQKKPKLHDVSIGDGEIFLNLNANDSFTNSMIISEMNDDIFKVLKALAQKDFDYKNILVAEYMILQDQYGKESDNMVYNVSISKENLKKIVWDNITFSNVPKFADHVFIHPVLLKK